MRYTDGALTSSHHLFDGNAVTRFHLFGKFNLRAISMTKHPHTIFNKSRCLVVYTAPRCANDPVLRFSFCSHFICLIAFRLRLPHRLAGSGIRWRGNVPQIPRGGYFPQIIPRNRRFCSRRLPPPLSPTLPVDSRIHVVAHYGENCEKHRKKSRFCEFSHRFSRVCSLSFRHLEIGQGGVASCRKQASTNAHREDAQLDRSHGRAAPRF